MVRDVVVDDEWVDKRSELLVKGLDERVLLRVYRFCKSHYEFFIGFLVCFVLFVLVSVVVK